MAKFLDILKEICDSEGVNFEDFIREIDKAKRPKGTKFIGDNIGETET